MQISKRAPETALGFRLIGSQAMKNGEFEVEETRIVRQILPYVDIVINVGANIGYYCCIALSQEKYVVAFEPDYLNLQYLLRNIEANDWSSQIEIYPIALSDRIGVIEMYGGSVMASLVKGWAGTPAQYVNLVPSSTLDHILGSKLQNRRSFWCGCDLDFVLVMLEPDSPPLVEMIDLFQGFFHQAGGGFQ